MKEKILEGALTLFTQYGVRSVSMDDVARELSVSKKTLYQHFKNKDDLVSEAVRRYLTHEKENFEGIKQSSENAVVEIFNMSRCLREHTFKINPSLIYDLQKYHAAAWSIFEEFKNTVIIDSVCRSLVRGKEEGYFREEINPIVLAVLRMEVMQLLFSEQAFPRSEYNRSEVQRQVFDHFVHGILSDKGKELYQQYQIQEKSLK